MENNVKRAREIINEVIYITLATVTPEGKAWNSPLFSACDEKFNFYWSSHPDSQHSINIAHNGDVFVIIYNSLAREGEGDGVYIQAKASQVTSREEIAKALRLLGARRGKPFNYPDKFIEGPQRIYKAEPQKMWINDAQKDADGDFIKDYRIELSLTDLQTKSV